LFFATTQKYESPMAIVLGFLFAGAIVVHAEMATKKTITKHDEQLIMVFICELLGIGWSRKV